MVKGVMKLESEDEVWIYESPDQGKTVTRRPKGSMDKEIKAPDNVWYNLSVAANLLAARVVEQKIREQHPAVMSAWQEYQLLLNLASKDIN